MPLLLYENSPVSAGKHASVCSREIFHPTLAARSKLLESLSQSVSVTIQVQATKPATKTTTREARQNHAKIALHRT